MPFINPFAFGKTKVTPVATKGKTTTVGAKPSPTTNPKAPRPSQPTYGATEQTLVYTDQKSLTTTGLTQGNTILLPQQGIVEIDLNFASTITGTVSNTGKDVAQHIDHIDFFDGDTGQNISNIPGGTYLYDHLVRFYQQPGAYVSQGSALSNALGTSATSASVVFRIPIKIPAPANSPHKMIVYYATIASAAGSATSVAVTTSVYCRYGDAGTQWMCVRYQTVNLVSGNNFLNQIAVPANVPIVELFLRTGSIASISWVQILSGSSVVLPYTEEAVIAARDTADFGSAFQTQTLALDLGTQWSIGPSSQMYINCSGAITGEQLVWVYNQ